MTNAPMRPFNSWDMIKIIGLLFMFVDHMGAYFFIHNLWMRSVGRGAAPIFLFLAGYASSYRFSRELLVLASIMLLSNFILGEYTQPLNILFTILGCRALFHLMEKRGKVIEKPWEWFIVLALFIVFTCFLFQYGTLGVMFAVCGYMKRRPERYSLTLQKLFLAGTLLCCAATFALFFDLTSSNVLLMIPVLGIDYWLLSTLEVRTLDMRRFPAWFTRILGLISHYSGRIYVAHLLVISWVTHYPI